MSAPSSPSRAQLGHDRRIEPRSNSLWFSVTPTLRVSTRLYKYRRPLPFLSPSAIAKSISQIR
jgi:hypothetical protein